MCRSLAVQRLVGAMSSGCNVPWPGRYFQSGRMIGLCNTSALTSDHWAKEDRVNIHLRYQQKAGPCHEVVVRIYGAVCLLLSAAVSHIGDSYSRHSLNVLVLPLSNIKY